MLERRNSLCLVELDGDADYEGPAYKRVWMRDPREAASARRETAPRVTVVKEATPRLISLLANCRSRSVQVRLERGALLLRAARTVPRNGRAAVWS